MNLTIFKTIRNIFKTELQLIEENAYNERAKLLVIERGKERADKDFGYYEHK